MKLLIVRLGALGDIVHALPVAAALRRAYPDARIDWLVSARHREILDLVTVLNDRIVTSGRAFGGDTSLAAVARAIRSRRYDAVIDAQGLLKSAVMARSTGSPRVIGFAARYLREPMARFLYTETHDPGGEGMYAPSETRHVVTINLGLLEPLGITSPAVEFPIERRDGPVLADVQSRAGGSYAVLNPGAAWPNKRWPPLRLGAIANALQARHALRSVVLWGPGERELADEVAAQSGGAAIVAPATTIADIVSVVRHAVLMVSGDTGPTHIASAVGTPLVGIYGPTRPERNGPLLPDDVTVSRASVCECHHLRRCRREMMCLLDIQVEEVLTAVERRLSASAAHG